MDAINQEIPEKLRPGTFLFDFPAAVDPEGGVLSYYIYDNPDFRIPLLAITKVYQSLSYSFHVAAGDTFVLLLVEARDTAVPPLSAWLFVRVTITATTAIGPSSGACYSSVPCSLLFRGAGGRWPWTQTFFLDLFSYNSTSGALTHVVALGELTRTAQYPAQYVVSGDTSQTPPEDPVTADVRFLWTPLLSLPLGLYVLMARSPFSDVDQYSSWTYSAPFTVRAPCIFVGCVCFVTPSFCMTPDACVVYLCTCAQVGHPYVYTTSSYSKCTFVGAANCGNGFLTRAVGCANVTGGGALVDDQYCRAFVNVRPLDTAYCFEPCVFYTTEIGPWSLCPANCGQVRVFLLSPRNSHV